MARPDFVPTLINAEPPAFLGLSLPEVLRIAATRVMLSILVFEVIGMWLLPHIFTFFVGMVLGVASGLILMRMKARKVLEVSRGKDVFYSAHKDSIEWERLKRKMAQYGIPFFKVKEKDAFIVDDGYWSQR